MGVQPVDDDVAARYARPSGGRDRAARRLLVVAGAVAVVLAFVSVASSVLDHEVRWRDVSFDVVSAELVTVTCEVSGREGAAVRCQGRAADARYGDVGQLDVDLGPLAAAGESATVEVRTLGRASSASVRTCELRR